MESDLRCYEDTCPFEDKDVCDPKHCILLIAKFRAHRFNTDMMDELDYLLQ